MNELNSNSTPMAPTQPPMSALSATGPTKTTTQPLSEDELAPFRSRGRLRAVFTTLVSGGMIVATHILVLKQHMIYYKLLYGGTMFLAVSLAALWEPLIMFRHLPIGNRFPKSVRPLSIVAMALGAAAGGLLHFYYRG